MDELALKPGSFSSAQPMVIPYAPVSTSTAGKKSTPVVTSSAATKDLNKIKNTVTTVNTDIQNQQANIAKAKAESDAAAAAKSAADAAAKIEADKAAAAKAAADAKKAALGVPTGKIITAPDNKQYEIGPDGQISGGPTNGAYRVGANVKDYPDLQSLFTGTSTQSAADRNRADLAKANADFETQAKLVTDTITNIQSGAIPLTPAEQAQVDGLKQQFQQLINEQTLQNKGSEGLGQIRGYQTGAGEYDPTFQVKTIGSIITAGQNKIADLNTKMASAVATLTQSFKDNNIKAIKDAWDIYKEASKKKTDALNKTIEDTQTAIKDAKDAKIAADKVIYDTITKPIQDIGLDLAKNNAPKEIRDAVASAATVDEAIANAGEYLQTATGDLGDYLQYKRDTMGKGLVPKDYDTWLTEKKNAESKRKSSEAYATEYAKVKGKADAEAAATKAANAKLIADMKARGVDATKFNAAIDQAANMETTVAGKEAVKRQLTDLIASGDYENAYVQMANTVENGLVGEAKQRFANARSDYQVMIGLENAVRAYTDAGGSTGLLKGTAEEIARKLGQVTDPKLTELAVQLQREFQTYRNTMTGAAFGAKESREYESVNPTTGKKLDLNLSVIEGAKNQLRNRVEGTINARIPAAKEIKKLSPDNVPVNAKAEVERIAASDPEINKKIADAYKIPGMTDEAVLEFINNIKKMQK
jgi:hypothetical protein